LRIFVIYLKVLRVLKDPLVVLQALKVTAVFLVFQDLRARKVQKV
jgi:hypothetical protein